MNRKYLLFFSKLRILLISLSVILLFINCPDSNKTAQKQKSESVVKTIYGKEAFKTVVESAGDRLLMFDLYADWCGPCRVLSPMLEEIAKENQDNNSNNDDIY